MKKKPFLIINCKNKPHLRQLRWGFSYPITHFPSFRVRHTAKDFGKSIISFHSFPESMAVVLFAHTHFVGCFFYL